MNPLDFALLADENIAPEPVAALRERRIDVCTLHDLGLSGAADADILSRARLANRIVLTHDADFGLLAVRRKMPFTGVIFLRPGHIKSAFSLGALDTLRSAAVDVEPPFLIVLERRQDRILIRLRSEPQVSPVARPTRIAWRASAGACATVVQRRTCQGGLRGVWCSAGAQEGPRNPTRRLAGSALLRLRS